MASPYAEGSAESKIATVRGLVAAVPLSFGYRSRQNGNSVQAYSSYRLITKATMAAAFKQQRGLAETIKLKEINLDKTRSDRVREAEMEMEYRELKAESEEATQRFETIVRLMNEEIARFQEHKTLDMGIASHEFAKGQAHLTNEVADAWGTLLRKLEACSTS